MPRGPMPGRGGPMSGRGRPKPGGMLRMGGLPPPKPSKQKSPDGTMPGAKNSVTSPSSPPGPKGGPSAQGKLPPKRNKEVLRNQGTPGKRMPGRKMGVPVTGKLNLPLKPDGKRQPPGGNQEQKTSRGGQQSVFPSLVGFETNGTMTAGGGTGGRLIVAQGPAPSKEVKQSQASMTWYTLSTEEERKAYLIPQPSGRCGGGGEPFYNLHGPMPFYAGSALRSGRFILGGGGGQKGTGVGSGLCIFDVKKNCPLIPFASFDSNDRLISCIAEHPSGSEVVLSIDECVYAFLVTTDGEGFHLIDDWVVIPPNSPEKVNTSDPAEEVDPPQVTAIAFSFAGDLIATGGEDGQVRVWQYHSKQMVALFKVDEPENDVSSIALTPDSKFVLTCSNKTHCTVWSMADKKAFKQLKFSDVPDATFHNIRMVRTVSLVSDEVQESTFAVAVLRTPTRGGWSYLVKYDIASWEAVQATRVAQSRVAQSSVSNDGRLIAVSTVDGKIMIFDTTSFACIHTVKSFHNLPGTAICFSNDDKHLVSVSSDKSYALVPIEGIASKKSHGCTQAIVRTVLQILLVVIIAHIVTWNK